MKNRAIDGTGAIGARGQRLARWVVEGSGQIPDSRFQLLMLTLNADALVHPSQVCEIGMEWAMGLVTLDYVSSSPQHCVRELVIGSFCWGRALGPAYTVGLRFRRA